QSRALRESDTSPVTMGRALSEIRAILPSEAIIFTSSGNVQAQVFQEMAFTQPRTYISAGGFSTMGWSFPAALGAKLAAPDVPVLALVGDGDFLMTVQELATAVQYNIPVITVVLNNQGWQAIRDLQTIAYGEETVYATMFERGEAPVTPHIADVARAFGAHAVRICHPDEVGPALREALRADGPSVIEVMIDMTLGTSGGLAPGWWDVPVPEYLDKRREIYERERSDERV
ncbi:MAG: thiamine pyrophosphate-binding protein, partial [Anaerolineae bacterium]|nr:thiamine pyrophosphate-binding protein [Anaerolineae bacterium]